MLTIKKLKVKAKGGFCSLGEGKNGRNLHTYHSGFQMVKGEGEGKNSELGECAMWEHVSA